jgi:hypothetical protein
MNGPYRRRRFLPAGFYGTEPALPAHYGCHENHHDEIEHGASVAATCDNKLSPG